MVPNSSSFFLSCSCSKVCSPCVVVVCHVCSGTSHSALAVTPKRVVVEDEDMNWNAVNVVVSFVVA